MAVATQLDFYRKIVHDPNTDYHKTFYNALRSAKVVHYTGVPEGTDLHEFYPELVGKAGDLVARDENPYTGDQTKNVWLDIRYDQDHGNTFRHSNTRQPLHTDGAYTSYDLDVSLFYCLENADTGGATTFYDLPDLIAYLERWDPALLNQLRSLKVIFDKGDEEQRITPVLFEDEKGPAIQWNYYRVSPKNKPDVIDMCAKFHTFLEERIVGGGLPTAVKLNPTEAIFFHDHRLLHGRNSFLGNRCLIKGGLML